MNAWVALVLAGAFEVGFTSSMKMAGSPAASRWWTALFWVSVISSFALLSTAIKTIPLGTAYAVWTGIGAVGTAIVGILFFKDPATFWRMFFLSLLIGSIVGLKVVTK
jgi:quaternary ammonium compound-resistance protein SugE